MIERIAMHRGFLIELDLLMGNFIVVIETTKHTVPTLTEVYDLISSYYRDGGKLQVLNLKTLEITSVSEFTYHKLIEEGDKSNYIMITADNKNKVEAVITHTKPTLDELLEKQASISKDLTNLEYLIKSQFHNEL